MRHADSIHRPARRRVRRGRLLPELLLAMWLLLVVGAAALRMLEQAMVLLEDARRLDAAAAAGAALLGGVQGDPCGTTVDTVAPLPPSIVLHADRAAGRLQLDAAFLPPPYAPSRRALPPRTFAWRWPCP